jgi:hypothetical protein
VSSTDLLLDVATSVRLFHASDGTGFADLIHRRPPGNLPLRGKRFQAWLRQQYYERPQRPAALAVGYPRRLTSGGAFSTRRLFTDQDEIFFAAGRPVLNGIEVPSPIRAPIDAIR